MKTDSRSLRPTLLLTLAQLGFASLTPGRTRNMKHVQLDIRPAIKHKTLLLLSISLLLASLSARHALAQTSNRTVIVYQGLVKQDGVPANGPVDMTWGIYDAETNGNLIAQGQVPQVPVQDGLFTLPMDLPALGDNALPPPDGSTYGTWWMELCLRFPTLPGCRLMSPRQRITPTVQALSARVASTVRDGAVTAAKLAAGAVSTPNLQNGAVTGGKIADGNVVRSFNGLKDQVTLSADDGILVNTIGNDIRLAAARSCTDYTNCYWNLLGNGNITGANFLGTVAGEFDPLEFRVNNIHAMHIVAAGVSTPSIVGGHSGNSISVGVIGAHIGGGGEPGSFNSIAGNYDTIGGGSGHAIHKPSEYATIGGGNKNTIQTNSSYSTIGGGDRNTVNSDAIYATVGGGAANNVAPGARWSTVGGGVANSVGTNVGYGFIGGGTNNTILTSAVGAAIVGGQANSIQQGSTNSAIGGGARNVIQTSIVQATIAGGGENTIRTDADSASVGGGSRNLIFASTPYATIPGGQAAAATNYGQFAYASGPFTAAGNGEAQLSLYVLRRSLPTATTAELFLDGDTATRRMNLRPESTWTFDILVTARTDAGSSAGYRITGVIKNSAGVTSLVGVPLKTVLAEQIAAWDANVTADNDALTIMATGDVVLSRWVATVRTSEVIY